MPVNPPYLCLVALLVAGASCERAPTGVDEFETAPEWVATGDLEIAGLDDEGRGLLAPDAMHVRGAHAYLLHRRERRIRVFDRATGDRLRTLVGPDEMQSPRGFGGYGDTLWVSDNLPEPMFRLFAAETGGVIGKIRVGEWRGRRGASPSGRVTGTRLAPGGEMVASPAIASEQVVRGEVRERVLLRMSVWGEILDTLATVSVERGTLGFVQDGGGGIYAAVAVRARRRPLGHPDRRRRSRRGRPLPPEASLRRLTR